MALNEINFALGPKDMLEMIAKRHAERNFLFYRSVSKHDEYLLVDVSGQKSVFESGLNYRVLTEIEDTNWDGLLELRYLTLDTDQQKVFSAVIDSWKNKAVRPLGLMSAKVLISLKKDFQFVLLNNWENEEDQLAWSHASNNQIAQFGHDGNKAAVVRLYERVR